MNTRFPKALALSLISSVLLLNSTNLPIFNVSNSVVAQESNLKQDREDIMQRLNQLNYQGNIVALRSHFVVNSEQIDEFIDLAAEVAAFTNSKDSPVLYRFFQNNDKSTEIETIRRLSQEWIEQGFAPEENTKNYTYEKYLSRFYDPTPGAVTLHDNNDPQMRIETDAKAYSRIWEELFANLDYVGNKLTKFYQVEVETDLAFSSFTANAIVESDGERTVMPVFYTLIWRKTTDGWRIIHEHGSNLITENSPVAQAK